MSEHPADPAILEGAPKRSSRHTLGLVALGAFIIVLPIVLLVVFTGSGKVAQSFADAVHDGRDADARALCEAELGQRVDLAALAWMRAGPPDLTMGAGGLTEGFTPYMCHEARVEPNVAWLVMKKRGGVWRVAEVHPKTQPKMCESSD